MTEQSQSNLGFGQFAQSLQDLEGFGDPALRVPVAELRAADWATEQLKVAIPDDFEVGRELTDVDSGRRAPGQHQLALVLVLSTACA